MGSNLLMNFFDSKIFQTVLVAAILGAFSFFVLGARSKAEAAAIEVISMKAKVDAVKVDSDHKNELLKHDFVWLKDEVSENGDAIGRVEENQLVIKQALTEVLAELKMHRGAR